MQMKVFANFCFCKILFAEKIGNFLAKKNPQNKPSCFHLILFSLVTSIVLDNNWVLLKSGVCYIITLVLALCLIAKEFFKSFIGKNIIKILPHQIINTKTHLLILQFFKKL